MNEHSIFYYPYASFRDDQVPLLKAAALYFDKLYILDPVKASWDMVGPAGGIQELRLLEQEGILHRVAPEEVLKVYEKAITAEILADMRDPKFLSLCQRKGRGRRWTLALAKVPKEIRSKYQSLDTPMRRLMRDIPRKASMELKDYEEGGGYFEGEPPRYVATLNRAADEISETFNVYDEYREGGYGVMEYRYTEYPLSLGEAIMINHALFGGFLYTGAVPITDNSFHNEVLNLKIKSASNIPKIRAILKDRAKQRQLKKSQLAIKTLTDLDLAIISPKIPMEEILQYRKNNADALGQTRQELGILARTIESQPWTEDFENELETKVLPKVHGILNEGKRIRNSWLESKRGRLALKAAGVAVGTATAVLAVFAAPLTPVALATAGLGLVSGAAIPGAEWLFDWRDGKRTHEENGLHYLFSLRV